MRHLSAKSNRLYHFIFIFGCFSIFDGHGQFLIEGLFEKGEGKFAAGMLGSLLSWIMVQSFGTVGTYIIVILSFVAGVILISSYDSLSFSCSRR